MLRNENKSIFAEILKHLFFDTILIYWIKLGKIFRSLKQFFAKIDEQPEI